MNTYIKEYVQRLEWIASGRVLRKCSCGAKLNLRHKRTKRHVRLFVCPSVCLLCLSGTSILLGGRGAMRHRNLRGKENPCSINNYTKFGQLIIRKIIKILSPDVTF